MSVPQWCQRCGLQSRNPRMEPIQKYHGEHLCFSCRTRQEREDANKCKCSGLPISPKSKASCEAEKH
jgi:hypothetical protein